jgi:hypothetical protein
MARTLGLSSAEPDYSTFFIHYLLTVTSCFMWLQQG